MIKEVICDVCGKAVDGMHIPYYEIVTTLHISGMSVALPSRYDMCMDCLNKVSSKKEVK